MLGTAFVIAGVAGGVETVMACPSEMDAARRAELCVTWVARTASAMTAQQPTIAAYHRNLLTTVTFIVPFLLLSGSVAVSTARSAAVDRTHQFSADRLRNAWSCNANPLGGRAPRLGLTGRALVGVLGTVVSFVDARVIRVDVGTLPTAGSVALAREPQCFADQTARERLS